MSDLSPGLLYLVLCTVKCSDTPDVVPSPAILAPVMASEDAFAVLLNWVHGEKRKEYIKFVISAMVQDMRTWAGLPVFNFEYLLATLKLEFDAPTVVNLIMPLLHLGITHCGGVRSFNGQGAKPGFHLSFEKLLESIDGWFEEHNLSVPDDKFLVYHLIAYQDSPEFERWFPRLKTTMTAEYLFAAFRFDDPLRIQRILDAMPPAELATIPRLLRRIEVGEEGKRFERFRVGYCDDFFGHIRRHGRMLMKRFKGCMSPVHSIRPDRRAHALVSENKGASLYAVPFDCESDKAKQESAVLLTAGSILFEYLILMSDPECPVPYRLYPSLSSVYRGEVPKPSEIECMVLWVDGEPEIYEVSRIRSSDVATLDDVDKFRREHAKLVPPDYPVEYANLIRHFVLRYWINGPNRGQKRKLDKS